MSILLTLKWILQYLMPIISISGIIGNTLSLIIYTKKGFTKDPCALLFQLKSFMDIIVSFYLINDFLKELGIDLELVSELGCKLSEFPLYVSTFVSVWSFTLISFYRFMQIKFSYKFSKFTNRKQNQYIVIIINVIVGFLLSIPLIFSTRTDIVEQTNETMYTDCDLPENLRFFWWLDIILTGFLPFTLMTIFSCIITKLLFDSKKRTNRKSFKDFKFAITTISLNVSFIVLTLPSEIFFLLADYIHIDDDTYHFVFVLTDIFYFANFSIIFYLNICLNSMFRKEFLILFSKAKTQSNNKYTVS